MAETDVMISGRNIDKTTARIIEILNELNANKSPLLVAGSNITLTPLQDGTVRISASGGGGGSSTLADLTDVNLSNPSNNQVLVYDATNDEWVNANQSGGGSYHQYSTTEQVIGEWIDGKPLYEKTIIANNLSMSNGVQVAHNVTNFKMCVSLNVHLYDENSEITYGVQENGLGAAAGTTIMGFRVNTTDIYCIGNESWSGYPYRTWYFTIQYTKTTD